MNTSTKKQPRLFLCGKVGPGEGGDLCAAMPPTRIATRFYQLALTTSQVKIVVQEYP